MNDTAEVYLWGTRIGIIHQDISKAYASFEYDKNFINSRIELSLLRMPLGKNIYEFPTLVGELFYGMPGVWQAVRGQKHLLHGMKKQIK